jgi:hypothetical protein
MADLDLEDAPNNPNLQVNENSNANAAVIRHAVFRSVRLMNLMEAIENNPVLAEFCNNDVRGLPSVHELEENRNNPDYASLLNGPCVNDLRNAENYANALSQVSDDPRYFDFSQVANNDLEALEQSAAQQAREAQNRFEEDWQQQQFPPGQ